MLISLRPDHLFSSYKEITPTYIKNRGIKLILCDLDYTLAPKSISEPDENVIEWIKEMKDNDISVMILSNNRNPVRVEKFCGHLGIMYEGHAKKPFGDGFERAMKKAGVCASETAMLGDKLLTDMLGANIHGTAALMVEPLGGPVTLWQKVLYLLQLPFKKMQREKI